MANLVQDRINKIRNAVKAAPINNELDAVAKAKATIQELQGSSNPRQAVEALANTNPKAKAAKDWIDSNGGDAQTAALSWLAQNGINTNSILSLFGGNNANSN